MTHSPAQHQKNRIATYYSKAAAGLLSIGLVAAACGGGTIGAETVSNTVAIEEEVLQDDQVSIGEDSSSGGSGIADDSDSGAEATSVVEVVTVYPNEFVTHPNGAQAWLKRIDVGPSSTEVEVQIANGHDFRTTFRDDMVLVADTGQQLTFEPTENIEVEESVAATMSFSFPPLDPGTTSVSFSFNEGTSDADDDAGAQGPRFVFRDVPIEGAAVSEPLVMAPAPVGLQDAATHPNNSTLEVEGMVFTDSRIGVAVTARNGDDSSRRDLGGSSDATYLIDDLGNRYNIADSEENEFLRIDAGQSLNGFLVFVGHIHPDASEVTLVVNDDSEVDDEFTSSPKFVMGPYAVAGGQSAAALPQALSLNEEQDHPNGLQSFELRSMEFSPSQTTISFSTENDLDREAGLNANEKTFLADNVGNRYPLLAPVGNEDFEIPGRSGLEGSLSFAGRIAPDATEVTFFINDRGAEGYTSEMRIFPSFKFGPYRLTAGAAVSATPPNPAAMPGLTSLAAGQLEVSSADEVALVFDEFSGVEVPGGVLLTLPEGILFDSGDSELGRDADDALFKIGKVMEFYDGDRFEIIGNTDSVGSDTLNQELSIARAQSVVDALIRNGADPSRLTATGNGELDPVASNDTDEGRAQNRRVEVFISTTKGLPN